MKHLLWLSIPLLTLGCMSSGDSGQELDFYDHLLLVRAEHDAAMTSQDFKTVQSLRQKVARSAAANQDKMIRDLQHDDTNRQMLALFGLSMIQNVAARNAMLPLLRHANPQVRAVTAASIGLQREPSTPPAVLAPLLDDPEELVRHGALFGLSFLVTPRSDNGILPAVIRRLDESSDQVRSEAYMVLRAMALPSTVKLLSEKGLKDSFPVARLNAAAALGTIGTDAFDAVPELINALRDSEHEVVNAVWHALRYVTQRTDLNSAYHTWSHWFEEDEKLYMYLCAQHSTDQRDRPGKCPTCGDALKRTLRVALNKETTEILEGDYVCPNHPGARSTIPMVCPKCGERTIPRTPPAPTEPKQP